MASRFLSSEISSPSAGLSALQMKVVLVPKAGMLVQMVHWFVLALTTKTHWKYKPEGCKTANQFAFFSDGPATAQISHSGLYMRQSSVEILTLMEIK